MPPDPPSLVYLCKLDIHVTPPQKILATGLIWVVGTTGSKDYSSGMRLQRPW